MGQIIPSEYNGTQELQPCREGMSLSGEMTSRWAPVSWSKTSVNSAMQERVTRNAMLCEQKLRPNSVLLQSTVESVCQSAKQEKGDKT